jgi:hypothetical protein
MNLCLQRRKTRICGITGHCLSESWMTARGRSASLICAHSGGLQSARPRLVTVNVKVPDHYRLVSWRSRPARMFTASGRSAATRTRRHGWARWGDGAESPVGLQGQMSPAINYVKGSGRRGLCRTGADRDDDRLCPELRSHDRVCLPGRSCQWGQPADDHRRPSDRCAAPLPRRIPRADGIRRQPARPDPAGSNR